MKKIRVITRGICHVAFHEILLEKDKNTTYRLIAVIDNTTFLDVFTTIEENEIKQIKGVTFAHCNE